MDVDVGATRTVLGDDCVDVAGNSGYGDGGLASRELGNHFGIAKMSFIAKRRIRPGPRGRRLLTLLLPLRALLCLLALALLLLQMIRCPSHIR